ncbi:MAG: hypothetical protein IJP66_04715 [Kiritimatiellae bacterium]|nr:hypothetical protein [Kiritimatiellia bacterium]
MKIDSFFGAAAAAAALLCGTSSAASLPPLPKTSTVAAKIDFAKARSLPATSAALDRLFAVVPELRSSEKMLSKSFGLDARADVSSVLAFADGFALGNERVSLLDASSVADGRLDTARLAAAVRRSPGFSSARAGSLEAMTADFARGRWLAFPESGRVLISTSKAAMAKAAAAMAESPAPTPDFLKRALSADCPAVAAIDGSNGGRNLSALTGGILRIDAQGLVARVTEKTPGTARIEVVMTFADEKQAAQTLMTLMMLTALGQAKNGTPDPLLQRLMESEVAADGCDVKFAMTATTSDFSGIGK